MPIRFDQKPGIVAYLTVGDPDLATTRALALAAIDAGADVLELGVPFSDPLADGPVIQRASERAVARGTTLADVLALAAALRLARPRCGLVLFSYLNPVVRYDQGKGYDRFCAAAAAAGVDGVLLTDMIVEEAADYLAAMDRHGLAPIFLAAPTSPDERLKKIAEVSRGFVYVISRVGVTGAQASLESDAERLVARLRRYTGAPACGRLWHLEREPGRAGRPVCRCRRHRFSHCRDHRGQQPRDCARGDRAIYRGPAPRRRAGPLLAARFRSFPPSRHTPTHTCVRTEWILQPGV